MKKQLQKPVSNLDLKLLDIRFIAIDDSRIYLTEALQSVRKAKLIQLPSLLMAKEKPCQLHNCIMRQDNPTLHSDCKNQSTLQTMSHFEQTILSSKIRSSQFSCLEEQQNKQNNQGKTVFSKHFQQEQSQNEIEKIKQQINARKLSRNQLKKYQAKSLPSFSQQPRQKNTNQQAQIQRYRRRINLVKRENLLIHKQITSLYRSKISQNKESLKKIRKIEPVKIKKVDDQVQDGNIFDKGRQNNQNGVNMKRTWNRQNAIRRSILAPAKHNVLTPGLLSRKVFSSPFIRQKINFYENLTQKSPFKQELQHLHKKMISNNLHKNFEQYLVKTDKRVPQFIKKLRN